MDMETELRNLSKVWLVTIISLCYCYHTGKTTPKGFPRLVRIFPVVILFLVLPLKLYTVHFGGTTSFFIAWLANFKLLLFTIDKGPLAQASKMSLPQFLAVASLPIKTLTTTTKSQQQTHMKDKDNQLQENPKKTNHISILNCAFKILILSMVLPMYKYKDRMHACLLYTIYSFHIYLALEIILVLIAALARTLLGAELEPQFDEPYLATSLQDFWGKRWNIMVSSIMKPTVYVPVIGATKTKLGREWAQALATMATFVVSGIMHELIFYYLGRLALTWEVTLFFVIHGVCLTLEVMLKRKVPKKWHMHRLISGPLAIGFVIISASWLFFPPFLRFNALERGLEEMADIIDLVKRVFVHPIKSMLV